MRKKSRIREILAELEHEMNDRMNTFKRLGTEAKTLMILGDKEMKVDKIYIQMACIVHELLPVIDMIKRENPNLEGLFDTLLTMYDKHIKEQSGTNTQKTS